MIREGSKVVRKRGKLTVGTVVTLVNGQACVEWPGCRATTLNVAALVEATPDEIMRRGKKMAAKKRTPVWATCVEQEHASR